MVALGLVTEDFHDELFCQSTSGHCLLGQWLEAILGVDPVRLAALALVAVTVTVFAVFALRVAVICLDAL